MVSTVTTSAITSLLRSQNGAAPSLKASSTAAQAIIDQLRRPTQVASAQPTATAPQTTAPSSSLPRGSLINVLV